MKSTKYMKTYEITAFVGHRRYSLNGFASFD